MRLIVAVTDNDWFALHASKPDVDEVNFWRLSPDAPFHALQPGEILLFKLHSPENYIAEAALPLTNEQRDCGK